MEYDVVLDDKQLKKLKVLKLKYNAEKVQRKNLGITKDDINDMAGEEGDNEEEFELEELEDAGDEEEEYEEGEEDENSEEEGDIDENENENENDANNPEDNEDEGDIEYDENLDDNLLPLHESDLEDNLELDSEELKTGSDEDGDEENVHGFIDPNVQLLTYRKRYREKKDDLKNEEKEKYTYNRKQKIGGTSNKEKMKFKPLMMVMPKKRREANQDKVMSMNKKIKNLKQQLGKFKRGNMILKKKGGVTHKKKKK
jgi:hypothetical protein